MLSTFVIDATPVVKVDGGDERSHDADVEPTPLIMKRIDEILASGRFKSAREWCRKAGVSENYIGVLRARLSTGEVKQAKSDEVAKLARAADVSVDWLLGESEQIKKSPRYIELINESAGVLQLAEVIEHYHWPPTLEPDQASEVIRRVRQDAFKATESLPQSYWRGRVDRLVAEVIGHAKDVPTREPAEDVDLTQESPEVREHRKRAKKR